MAYVKQNWECGETITADKLNHMEDGIENAGGSASVAVVHITGNDPSQLSADMTCDEMVAVIENGGMLFAEMDGAYYPLIGYSSSQATRLILPLLTFELISVNQNGVSAETIQINSDCSIAYNEFMYPNT